MPSKDFDFNAPWLWKITRYYLIERGKFPWWLRLLWKMKDAKITTGEFEIGRMSIQDKDKFRQYFGEGYWDKYHPEYIETIKGWKITIPW